MYLIITLWAYYFFNSYLGAIFYTICVSDRAIGLEVIDPTCLARDHNLNFTQDKQFYDH